MKLKNNKYILSGVLLLLFLTSLTTSITSINGLIDDNTDNELMISDSHYEDFSDESYKDPSTNVWGWGSGTITNTRDFSWELLDFYATPSPVRGLDVQGRNVYVVQFNDSPYHTIGCYDITNPRDILLLSERYSLSNTTTIAVDGDVAYTGREYTNQQFSTYNLSNPYGLNDAGAYLDYLDVDGTVTDIDPEGHLVYYTVYNSASNRSFRIAEAENPDVLIGIDSDWNSSKALGLEVEGHLAYIAASTDGLYILNVSTKYSPLEVGHVSLPGIATDVILDGKYAYVACGTAGVAVVDISDTTLPEIKSIYNTNGYASNLVLQGNTLFVADGLGGVCVLDVVNPHFITYVTINAFPSYVWDVELFGGVLVVASTDGIHTFQISAGDGITDFSQSYYENAWDGLQAWDVRVLGDVAYVAGGPDGFYTLNIRDPSNPILLDHVPLVSGSFRKLDVQGSFAHLITDYGYYIYDIQDPSDIKEAGFLSGNLLMDVCVRGELVYITWQLGGYTTINVTHPNLVSWANELDQPHFGTNITAIWVQGPHVYTVDDQAGYSDQTFRIFQTRDLTNQLQTDAAPGTSGYFYDVIVDGNNAYASDTTWLVIFNVTNPYDMFFKEDIVIDSSYVKSYGVWTFGPYILNAAGSDGVYLINATDFNNCEATQYTGATGALQITSSGDYTYVANKSSLIILRHFESAGDTYVPGIVLAQTTKLSTASGITITDATLTIENWHHSLCSYDFYLSADGGNHWESVTPGVLHVFTSTGEDLRWMVEMIGLRDRSDHIHSVTLNYNYDIIPIASEYSFLVISSGYAILFIVLSVAALSVFKKKMSIKSRLE
ncbi:MAG: LVIVD repeat-containing protein [Candidatus Heimdallarchaeaceae archaeon]